MSVALESRLTIFRNELVEAVAEHEPKLRLSARLGKTEYEEMNVDKQEFILQAEVGEATAPNQELLDQMVDSHGPRSVRLAVESERTIGGALDLVVKSCSGTLLLRPGSEGEPPVIGAEWKIEALFD